MSTKLAVAIAVLAIGLGVACTDDDEATPVTATPSATASPSPVAMATQTPTPTSRATQAPTSTPSATPAREPTLTYVGRLPAQPNRLPGGIEPLSPDTRTSIAELDAVIDALVAGDVDTLLALIAWRSYECHDVSADLPAPPRCPSGAGEGTIVDAVQYRAHYKTPDEVRAALEAAFTSELELCWIAESRASDGDADYGVKMRALGTSGTAYVAMDLDVRVDSRGMIYLLAASVEPSSIVPVCH